MNRNITATVLIILAIGIYFTLTESILGDSGKVQLVNAQYVSAIATAKKTLELQDQVNTEYNNLSADDKDRIAKMVPSSVDNIRLIIDLNNVAAKHGLTLTGITAQAADSGQPGAPQNVPGSPPSSVAGSVKLPTISAPTLDSVTIGFSATAPYPQFVAFLQDLEADLRIIDVTHLAMTASDTGVYTFQVGLKTYWLRQH